MYEVRLAPLPGGQITVMIRDVSERERVVKQLHESELRFRQMAETIQSVFYSTDLNRQQCLYVSPAYEAIWRRSVQSLYDDAFSFLAAIHPDDRPKKQHALQRQTRGESTQCEYRILHPDGTVRWIWDRTYPVPGEMGRVVGVAEDITQRKLRRKNCGAAKPNTAP